MEKRSPFHTMAIFLAGVGTGALLMTWAPPRAQVSELKERVAELESVDSMTQKRRAVRTEGAPRRGAQDAAVTIVEFSDFGCFYCARSRGTLERLLEQYEGEVAHVFKHFPLKIHPAAPLAHRATMAAQRQDHFWPMHDRVFASNEDLKRETLLSHAAALGLDLAQFERDLDDPALTREIERDQEEGFALGINGTPAFLIDGRLLAGALPLPAFRAALDEALAASKGERS